MIPHPSSHGDRIMVETPEVIDKPLTPEALGEMYRKMCEDPYFANVPGKIELDTWGRIIMSPCSTRRSHSI